MIHKAAVLARATMLVAVSALPALAQAGAKPGATEADVAKAKDLLTRGKYEEARALYQSLNSLSPGEEELMVGLGKAQLGCGDPDAAVETMLVATDQIPRDYEIILALGRALYEQGRACAKNAKWQNSDFAFQDAKRFLCDAAAINPKAAEPLLYASRAEYERGEKENALALIEQAAGRDANDIEVALELGAQRFYSAAAMTQSGDPHDIRAKAMRERATVAYESILKRHSADPRACGKANNGLGWVALQAGDTAAAVTRFTKSIELDPTIDDSYRQLVKTLSGAKEKRQQVVSILDRIVVKSNTAGEGDTRKLGQALAHFYRGKARGSLRDVAGLNADMKAAAEAWPVLKAACALQAALALYSTGEYAAAAARIVSLMPEETGPITDAVYAEVDPRETIVSLRGLADQIQKSGDMVTARDVFRIVAESQQNDSTDWNNYAFFCRETKKYNDSYAAYERAIDLKPDDPSLLNDAALILQYHLHRDLERALELYEKAIVEGNRVLEDPNADSFVKDAARTAVRDATNNSALLRASPKPKSGS